MLTNNHQPARYYLCRERVRWTLPISSATSLLRRREKERTSPVTRGNITSENNRTYHYDSLNQLVEVKDSGATIAEYTYNGVGQRIKKVASGVTRIFNYDLQVHLIAESDSSGTIAEYVYLGKNGRDAVDYRDRKSRT
jgi:YD repeat-containing protein